MQSTSISKSSYDEAIAHLSGLIPELFTGPGQSRRKFSLEEIGVLCEGLGNPQAKFPAVLVAGTNGKGSTASTLAWIARKAGLRVGLYTSPHLGRVNERIRIGGVKGLGERGLGDGTDSGIVDIPDADFARHYFRVIAEADRLVAEKRLAALPSFFELLTALAFDYFAASQVDLAVIEVGMGGRLDATNIVDPIVSVITDISLDHQEWLGATIDLIAREKAGILRRNGVLVTLPQHPEANQALGEVAVALEVRGVNAGEYMPQMNAGAMDAYPLEVLGRQIEVDSPLKGVHQHRNIALAIAAAVELAQRFPITAEAIEEGIRATHWPGRLERIQRPHEPEFVLDVAHNPAGAWALRSALSASEIAESQVLIFACLRDKPLQEMSQILFPIFDHVVLAPIHSPRASELADLMAAAAATGVSTTAASTVAEAIEFANGLDPARIVISGSLYLVGEARSLILQGKRGPSR